MLQLQNIVVWHDKAVFHFLTEEKYRQTYHSLVQKTVMSGGFVIMATFALNGAACAAAYLSKDTALKA